MADQRAAGRASMQTQCPRLVGSIPTWLAKDYRRPPKHSSVDRLPWPDSSKEPTVPPQWPDWSSLEEAKGGGLPSSSTHIIR
ncbi:hypothetical protein QQF64_022183 [Cirrhinus molitorella]|uniref:Uncharacterized protein n=1 Tax=Cirrhinus molitorella TaxID=172907 RepID=A0ABR3L902_9TELE